VIYSADLFRWTVTKESLCLH